MNTFHITLDRTPVTLEHLNYGTIVIPHSDYLDRGPMMVVEFPGSLYNKGLLSFVSPYPVCPANEHTLVVPVGTLGKFNVEFLL